MEFRNEGMGSWRVLQEGVTWEGMKELHKHRRKLTVGCRDSKRPQQGTDGCQKE